MQLICGGRSENNGQLGVGPTEKEPEGTYLEY